MALYFKFCFILILGLVKLYYYFKFNPNFMQITHILNSNSKELGEVKGISTKNYYAHR